VREAGEEIALLGGKDVRMKVLKGEWYPSVLGQHYWMRDSTGEISDGCVPVVSGCVYKPLILFGVAFAPTRELLEEYQLIQRGEGLPKKGDEGCAMDRSDYSNVESDNVAGFDYSKSYRMYFPSQKQLDQYIKSHPLGLPTFAEYQVPMRMNEELRLLSWALEVQKQINGDWVKRGVHDSYYAITHGCLIQSWSSHIFPYFHFETRANAERFRDFIGVENIKKIYSLFGG
jgi:hypothetical protein